MSGVLQLLCQEDCSLQEIWPEALIDVAKGKERTQIGNVRGGSEALDRLRCAIGYDEASGFNQAEIIDPVWEKERIGSSNETLTSCCKVNAIIKWLICSLRVSERMTRFSRRTRADCCFAKDKVTSMAH